MSYFLLESPVILETVGYGSSVYNWLCQVGRLFCVWDGDWMLLFKGSENAQLAGSWLHPEKLPLRDVRTYVFPFVKNRCKMLWFLVGSAARCIHPPC